jgi:hypothetical protein
MHTLTQAQFIVYASQQGEETAHASGTQEPHRVPRWRRLLGGGR